MRKLLPKYRLLSALISFILLLVIVPVVIVFAATVPAEINMQFTPIAIASGGTSTLRVSVFNLNGNPLTSATWTNTFPAGMTRCRSAQYESDLWWNCDRWIRWSVGSW